MDERPPLHVLFTMVCEGITTPIHPSGPRGWEVGARSIGAFCGRLLDAGYTPTLFVAPDCAEEQAPMLDELASRGCDLGLYLAPALVSAGRYKQPFGSFAANHQRELVEVAATHLEDYLGTQPRSFRAHNYSANDETFRTIYELGFRQGSLSSPGRNQPRESAVWVDALADAHHTDPHNRLIAGALPFLELPITTNPEDRGRDGVPGELCIEKGSFDSWQRPIIERHLGRMAAEGTVFRLLSITTHNSVLYTRPGEAPPEVLGPWTARGRKPLGPLRDVHTDALEALLDYFDELSQQYEIVPVSCATAHDRFRRMR